MKTTNSYTPCRRKSQNRLQTSFTDRMKNSFMLINSPLIFHLLWKPKQRFSNRERLLISLFKGVFYVLSNTHLFDSDELCSWQIFISWECKQVRLFEVTILFLSFYVSFHFRKTKCSNKIFIYVIWKSFVKKYTACSSLAYLRVCSL